MKLAFRVAELTSLVTLIELETQTYTVYNNQNCTSSMATNINQALNKARTNFQQKSMKNSKNAEFWPQTHHKKAARSPTYIHCRVLATT